MGKLGFLGKTRLQQAQTVLPTVIEHWRNQWCFTDARQPVEVAIEAVSTSSHQAHFESLSWQRADVGAAQLRCGGAWSELIYGVHANEVPGDATARHLLTHAQLALINSVIEALGHKPVTQLLSDASGAKTGPFSNRLLVRLGTPKDELYLLVDAELLNGFLPVRPSTTALVERKAAIGGAKLKLHVQLPLTRLPINDVQDIKVGDILRGDASLGQPLHLATAAGQIVANGYLARQHEHLAIQLVSRKNPEV